MTGPPTVKSALTNAIKSLAQASFDTPRLDAEVLLAHLLGKSRAWLYAHPEQLLSAAEAGQFQAIIARRLQHTPVAYLTGEREFYGLPFYVSPAVLIPRPETEHLVEMALAHIRPGHTVIDVGTGSGCIAVSLAVHTPARVIATDVSAAALAVARRNARRHGVEGRVRLVCANLLAGFSGPADIIVSNPPYIAPADMPALPATVRQFEPHLALTDGADGLHAIAGLLQAAPGIIRPGGHLFIEIGAGQAQDALRLARRHCPRARFEIRQDLAGKDRILAGQF